ncbi:MAG TPA: molybdopterin biosynthesis protein [Clostridiales bacterium]|nr:molybdopterin biosynthesis protein [Clostridiales bacterium]
MDRNIYLNTMDADEALKLFLDRSGFRNEIEEVLVIQSLGRVTADAVFAVCSSPNFNASAMDGIAVRAKDTYEASEVNPVILKKGQYKHVDTGDPITEPYDAVIMIEDVVEVGEGDLKIISPVFPWQNVRPIGEDIVANEMIIPSNHMINPVDIGALLAGGIITVKVYKKPTVGIIPTGTEIVEPGEKLEIGDIIESNSRMLEGLVVEYGGEPNRYAIVPDDYELLKTAIKNAVKENDIVVINAGSSAGSEDYTASLVKDMGELIVHGIATKPGKPVVLGFIENKPVMGVPGYPVSAWVVFEIFAKPLIKRWAGMPVKQEKKVEAVLSKRLVSSLKNKEFVRVKLGKVNDNLIATPLDRGAGITMSLVRADGILEVPQSCEGYEAGQKVNIKLLKDLEDIQNTIVSIGSHDLIMDIIGNMIHRKNSAFNLSSSHVGSMAGLMALKRGEAHMAPIHLLDEKTGTYNIEYIKRYLGNMDIVLIKGVKRIQGIMTKKNNPKGIKSIEDLARDDIQFVNRQKGAGTRILTDYLLKNAGIDTEKINGYRREMTTHMAVAAAIASGSADVGVGVYSAAKAMDLDFIPIGEEEYDFAIPAAFLNEIMIKLFIDVITSMEFKDYLEQMGGYGTENTGQIIKCT